MSEHFHDPIQKKARTEATDDVQQQQSHLLCLNNDTFLVLFAFLTQLLDAFNLGITCRQLYQLYKQSCARRQSLVLFRKDQRITEQFEQTFETVEATKRKDHHCSVTLPISISSNYFSQLFACLPNLTSLKCLTGVKNSEQGIPLLLAALRSSPQLSGRLQVLQLALNKLKKSDENVEVQPLALPALKHLTLFLGDTCGYTPTNQFLDSALFHEVLPQLSSFCLYTDQTPADLLRFVHLHVLPNAQLAEAAAGTPQLQIVMVCQEEVDPNLLSAVINHQAALAHVTNFISFNDWDYKNNWYLRLLPQMTRLKKVVINLDHCWPTWPHNFDVEVDECYPQVLTALATLQHLEEMEVFTSPCNDISNGKSRRWDKVVMPILPTVRCFTLSVCTSVHDNPVELFHLAHCFPRLQVINASYHQLRCQYCDYDAGGIDARQKCALEIARGLLRLGTGSGWQAQVKLNKLEVIFLNLKVKFSSLENLLAGIEEEDVYLDEGIPPEDEEEE